MMVFLVVGLVPTIICILYPPQLAIIEKEAPQGVHVGLNNWYTTRDFPSANLPDRLLQKITSQNQLSNPVNVRQEEQSLIIEPANSETVQVVQLYTLTGKHQQTTYLLNREKMVNIDKLNNGNYLMLLDVEGTVYLSKFYIH